MFSVQRCSLPPHALLSRYLDTGAYTDCYMVEVDGRFAHAAYVEAFYTTAVFKLERWLLARLASAPSTDAQARQLASGAADSFAAWKVESRNADQLLVSDISGRTRSWLMSVAAEPGHAARTRLYFGSAVVPVVRGSSSGKASMGFAFHALLGFHRLYSRVLLDAARARLAHSGRPPGP